ncbi:MAG: LacI family transcriptional regulator [Treponema sp.]|nr:LacI family transcriptional regulator [Treponema sp.]
MATIRDVAAMAGVSVSTVSYAMSGMRPISKGKKLSIENAMRQLNYKPHAAGRRPSGKKSKIIAILFPYVDHGLDLSEMELILQASKSAARRGYYLVIWTMQTNSREELQQFIGQSLVDGLILMEVHTNDMRIDILREQNIPFILLGRDKEDSAETFIDIDFSATMMNCISYLKDLDYRRVIFINQTEQSLKAGYGPVVRTHEAFSYFCRNFDIQGSEYFCSSDPLDVCAVTENILTDCPRSTAFIIMNNKALPGLIKGIEKSGRRIPDDVSVVAIVSSAGSVSCFVPPITAFEMDSTSIMDITVSQLIAKLNGKYEELPMRLIPCILRERQSTRRRTGN